MNNIRARYTNTKGYSDNYVKEHTDIYHRQVYEDGVELGLAYGYYCMELHMNDFTRIRGNPGWWIKDE